MADPPQYRDAGPGSHPFPWLPGPTPTRPAGDRSGATAEGLHHFAAETYPFLGELDAQKSVPVLSAGERAGQGHLAAGHRRFAHRRGREGTAVTLPSTSARADRTVRAA